MRLLIFDLDGVLRSFSWMAAYDAYKAIAVFLGKNPEYFWGSYNEFAGWIEFVNWPLSLEKMGVPLGSDYDPIRKVFHDVYDEQIVLFPWVDQLLVDLSEKHTLAVLTSSKSFSACKHLCPIADLFSHIITDDHVQNVKPDPEGIHLIMKETNFDATRTIMIGDTHADINAGKNAGVMTVGVTWDMMTAAELLVHGPDHIISDPFQLIQIAS